MKRLGSSLLGPKTKGRRWLRRLGDVLRPGEAAWAGASYGLLIWTSLATLLVGTSLLWNAFSPWNLLTYFLLVVALLAAGGVLMLLAGLVRRLPSRLRSTLLLLLPLLAALGSFGRSRPLAALIVAFSILVPALLGGGLSSLRHSRSAAGGFDWRRSMPAGIALAAGLALLGWGALWLLGDGPALEEPSRPPAGTLATAPPLPFDDPGKPGPWPVRRWTYGSGSDRHRGDLAAGAERQTTSVDGSALLDNWEGRAGAARTAYWGFDATALPLQARVWEPVGSGGPFPLVLMVHGNHRMEDFSDAGYAYLGEHLASHGFIFASIDENFLNGSLSDLLGLPNEGLDEENDARGWLLLEHLRQWRSWSGHEGDRLFGRVDLERVALIGHSRGGEAVAVAAAFNRLPRYPDDASVVFDYGFGIRSVVALAPVDGQYRPSGIGTPLHDLSYLVLQGSMDGDVTSFMGNAQWQRAELGEGNDTFKAAIWIVGANHGQFNTRWGRRDLPPPEDHFLDLRPILPAAHQRRLARVTIGAFLEATLGGDFRYARLFHDPETTRAWLADAVVLIRYLDDRTRLVATFDEDLDVTTGTAPSLGLSAAGLTVWREERVALEGNTYEGNSAVLGWSRDDEAVESPWYELSLQTGPASSAAGPSSAGVLPACTDCALVLDVADADEDPRPKDEKSGKRGELVPAQDRDDEGESADSEPIDLTVELRDARGARARLPLSRATAIPRRLKRQIRKPVWLSSGKASEPVFQTVSLPLGLFVETTPELDLESLVGIRLVFDRTSAGVILLDNVGFRRAPSP